MAFIDIIEKTPWESVREKIYSATEADVQSALRSTRRTLDDFAALISPVAKNFLEEMARESQRLTQERFGKTVQLYIPLYLSNHCQNACIYCGFSAQNKMQRKKLTIDELHEELKAIKQMGFEHILLVTGEASNKAGIEYFREVFPIVREYFSLISIEVQPLAEDEYQELIGLGLNTVYLYQETYNKEAYPKYHLKGKKSDYAQRIDVYERLGSAAVHKIGLGILAGLEDWRADSFFTAMHLKYLSKTYWRTKYSISFPRLRPHEGEFMPNYHMKDSDLLQLISAYRLFDNEVEIALSTRERPSFRDNMLGLGVTTMSAGSKTEPGGYAKPQEELEQFAIDDDRSPEQIAEMIRQKGYEPVWKDWDLVMQI